MAHSLHTQYIKSIQWLKEKISARHDIVDKLGTRKGIWETSESVVLIYRVVRLQQQKAFKRLAFLNSAILFINCPICEQERETIKFENLPEASKDGFKELISQETYKRGATFLFCRKCNEYSILSSPFY